MGYDACVSASFSLSRYKPPCVVMHDSKRKRACESEKIRSSNATCAFDSMPKACRMIEVRPKEAGMVVGHQSELLLARLFL